MEVSTERLTPRQRDVYEAVIALLKRRRPGLADKEIAEATGLGETQTRRHIAAIVEKGYLEREPGTASAIRLPSEA